MLARVTVASAKDTTVLVPSYEEHEHRPVDTRWISPTNGYIAVRLAVEATSPTRWRPDVYVLKMNQTF